MGIEDFENVLIRVLKEARRWERDESGQLMRRYKREYHPVSREDEDELRETLHQIVNRIDLLLYVFFGEEPRRIEGKYEVT